MTPAQLTALQGLLGRALSEEEQTALDAHLDYGNRQDVQITDLLNSYVEPTLRSLTVEEFFGVLFTTGDYMTIKQAALTGNQAAAFAFEVLKDAKALGSGRVDMELPATQLLLDSLQSPDPLLSAAGREALVAYAATKRVISINEVSNALNQAEGRMTL